MQIQTNIVFEQALNSKKRISVFQGGTRSGKTWNILIYWLYILLNTKNKILSIVRLTTPSLKKTVMRDFFEILNQYNLYNPLNHNKTDMFYRLNNNIVEFFSIDQPQKVRGGRRDYLFCNEANELPFEAWQQLIMRTSGKVILDYNPSDEFHWIYDKVLTREDCDFYISTYKDNPFIDDNLKKEIERLKDIDPNYWRVYGLGERAVSSAAIFPDFKLINSVKHVTCYGLDFGYNHPTALTAVDYDSDRKIIKARELIYQKNLVSTDLIEMFTSLKIHKNLPIYCDDSRPDIIKELQLAGYDARKADKSVLAGINFIQRHKLQVTKDSGNLIKELRSYKWRERSDGVRLDEPVKFFDDAVDSLRYAVFSYYKENMVSEAYQDAFLVL